MSEHGTGSTVLVIDDDKNVRQSVHLALLNENFRVLLAHDVHAAKRLLEEEIVDVMLIDIRLSDISGLEFYKKLAMDGSEIPAIFISGHASLTEAVQAVQLGAFDFIEKPFSADKLAITVKRCLEFNRMRNHLATLQDQELANNLLIGESKSLAKVRDMALKAAVTDTSVLILGDSGTGKELIANVIHQSSRRRDGPLVKVNCSAIPDTLVESEMFGHEKGAFTGATTSRRGFFELAHRGTIFLDEIGDLSSTAQAKVLRVLQSGELQKVGSERLQRVDVRVIAATHKDLKEGIKQGLFREDLFYRLNVIPLRVPSLVERIEDIPLLVGLFLEEFSRRHNLPRKTIEPLALQEMQNYPWPGNIRELKNVIERLLIMSGSEIRAIDLPEEILTYAPTQQGNGVSSPLSLKLRRDQAEREWIIESLKRHGGNVTKAAQELGIGRAHLHKKIEQLQIAKREFF